MPVPVVPRDGSAALERFLDESQVLVVDTVLDIENILYVHINLKSFLIAR